MYKNWGNNVYVRFEFWQKFKKFDSKIFITIFESLLNKTKTSEFNFDFYYWTIFEQNIKEFENDFECLKALYLYRIQTKNHFDRDKKYLNSIVKNDNDFLFVVLKLMYLKDDYVSSRHEKHSFEFIWEYDNFEYLLEKSFEILEDKYSVGYSMINIFFPVNTNKRVTDFISSYIIKNHNDSENLNKIFDVITYTYSSQRIYFLSILIVHVKDLEIIKSIKLIQSFKSGGNLIPLFEADRKFWKEFEELLSREVKFLKLKLWSKQKQSSCERSIELHRKRDFVSDF